MSKFLDVKYQSFEEYTPGEQPKDGVYTKLNTNESPYPAGPKTVAAVTNPERAANLRLYSDPTQSVLKQKLAECYGVRASNIFVSNGSDEILNFAFMAFGQDGILFPEISYGFYEVFGDINGREYEKVPLKEDFSIDVKDYIGRGKMIVIANPNAPTGKLLSLDEVEALVSQDPAHVVLIDEAYIDFGGVSAAPLVEKYENLLVVRTYSKSRSLAGARLGFSIASEEITKDLEKIKYSTNPYNVNSVTAAAGIAALEEDDYYMDNCKKIAETREDSKRKLETLGFQVIPSYANFLFAKTDRIEGGALYEKLKERKVLVRHFTNPLISDYNRITIGTPEQMDILLQAISEILAEGENR